MHKEKATVLGVAMAIFLIGCSDDAETKKNSQVIAKVNDTELTVHQLNYELGLLGQAAAKNVDKAAGQTLENMVNQQVVMQKAIADKLDRDPQIMQPCPTPMHIVHSA